MGDVGAFISVIIIIAASSFFGFIAGIYKSPINTKATLAVEACEDYLPRNQSCEYVITARIKEDK